MSSSDDSDINDAGDDLELNNEEFGDLSSGEDATSEEEEEQKPEYQEANFGAAVDRLLNKRLPSAQVCLLVLRPGQCVCALCVRACCACCACVRVSLWIRTCVHACACLGRSVCVCVCCV